MREYHDLEIKVLLCDYRENINAWKHRNVFNSWWFLYWNNCPGAIVSGEENEYRLIPEKVCLISPETVFATRVESPFNHFYMHFTVGPPFERIKSKIFYVDVNETLISQFKKAQALLLCRSKKPIQISLISQALTCLILSEIDENEFGEIKKYDPRIEHALTILDKETSTLIPNEILAEDVEMSVNGFIRLFANEVGITPQKYSRRRRIEAASRLLHFTDKKIEEIAEETGFLDRYYFSRAFKQITHYSPAEFRSHRISF